MEHVHAKTIFRFLNEVLLFEKRHLNLITKTDHDFWLKNEYRKLFVFEFRLFPTGLLTMTLAVSVMVTIFPFTSVRLIPVGVLTEISKLRGFGTVGIHVAEVIQRARSGVHSYLVVFIGAHRGLLTILMSIFSIAGLPDIHGLGNEQVLI